MYSEIIHTRCGDGIDIKKNQASVPGGGIGGFKVYSCTCNVTDDDFVDLQFLDKVLSEKQSYADPAFMDDAYLYYVPDIGNRILVNFHPIHFDRTVKGGSYPRRPGNFINQGFMGRFEDLYPYETFGNHSVWDAQERGEAFYYENAPTPLPQRDNLSDEIGNIGLDDIASFVADGRRDVLKSAIAFLVGQYDLPPEERKFLVIRDEDSRHLELWIAAIESAFSPRMASGLSFATRLDKFTNNNKYTVNLNGRYQPMIDLQNPDQKLRYRAMIVGVDGRDRTNNAAVRVLPNSPYVILDGKTKTLSAQVEASNPFYHFVTGFDDGHSYFCREFMQTVDLSSPSSDVIKLFVAYSKLESYGSFPVLKDVVSGLNTLSHHRLIKTLYLENLYEKIKANLSEYLKEDAALAFSVLNWLNKAAAVVGDTAAAESFQRIVCQSFASNVFKSPRSEKTAELVEIVGASSFVQEAAAHLTSEATVQEFQNYMLAYKSDDWVRFSEIFVSNLRNMRGVREMLSNSAREVFTNSIKAFYGERDGQGALKVADSYYKINPTDTVDTLLSDAGSSSDANYIGFILQLICRISPETVSPDRALSNFRHQLQGYRLDGYFFNVLAFKARQLTRPQEMERFLDDVLSDREFAGMDMSPILSSLDKNLVVSDKAAAKVAAKIQNNNTGRANCVNSAHICALSVIDDKRLAESVLSLVNSLIAQGFPSAEDAAYADMLMKKLFASKVSEEVFAVIVEASERSRFYADRIVGEAFQYLGSRQEGIIGEVIAAASRMNGGNLFNALVENCAAVKKFDKGMSAIRSTLRTKGEQQYFALVERDAAALRDKNKSGSIFGRFFSHGSSGDSKSSRWGKK